MSLRPQLFDEVPSETVRIARAAFPKGALCTRVRDELGSVFADEQFAGLFPRRGQPAASPGRLALVLVLQFVEGLTDRQAADAVRSRIDWKYLLGLEITDAGFDFSLLSEFRDRLIDGCVERQLLDTLLARLAARGLLSKAGKARTDSTHVLAAIRVLNRLENVSQTVRVALEALAVVDPDWLRSWVPAEWFDRYSARLDTARLPKSETGRAALAEQIGVDGWRLLTRLTGPDAPPGLRDIAAVQVLRQVWVQQYWIDDRSRPRLRGKDQGSPPAGIRIDSPYDIHARRAVKRSTGWTGYKVHLTETCDPDTMHVITEVITTEATVNDVEVTDTVHANLARRDLLPGEHVVDSGYTSAERITAATEEYRVELVGPVARDPSWQARAGAGFDVTGFTINWQARQIRCPEGNTSIGWTERDEVHGRRIHAGFAQADCRPCPSRTSCIRGKTTRRNLTLHTQTEHEALTRTRREQDTPEWKTRYAPRAGVEGTISQGVRAFQLRRTRYIGLAKTHLQHTLTAIAMNLVRADAWLTGTPHGTTRTTHFAALRPAT